jgi:lipoate-protein ligase A
MEWRVLDLNTYGGHMNMALDDAVSEAVAAEESPPTIRFYSWNPSTVSFGYHQKINEALDIQKCHELGVEYVRRRSGGGAVFHDKEEITYSVTAPEYLFPNDLIESYKIICGWLIEGLHAIGLDGKIASNNDITVFDRKISGNAQHRGDGVLLQHGTILYNTSFDTMFSVLKTQNVSKVCYPNDNMTHVGEHSEVSRKDLYNKMLWAFTKGKEYKTSKPSKKEWNRSKELVETRYSTREWNFLK